MTDNSGYEQHLSAARGRWGDDAITDRTDESVARRNGTIPPGVPAFEYDPTGQNPTVAVETAKSVLNDHGYDVFYRLRDSGQRSRDPTALIAVPGRNATPVVVATESD